MSKKYEDEAEVNDRLEEMFEEEYASEIRALKREREEMACWFALFMGLTAGIVSFMYFAKKIVALNK